VESKASTVRRILLPLIFLAFALSIVYYTISLNRVSCTVCIEYDGNSACRTASGATREEAISAATDNACAQVTSGMGNVMRCSQVEPTKVECGIDGG
jgi:hypothetical protein